ncbi:hypothetical protein C8J56DRAFT_544276 [Mycena floridula]|nr:hypothetical protein C8J56DRAFT_544276 [Mycena floridula]
MGLYSCRWSWCRTNFKTHKQLISHVIHDHVRTSVPVSRFVGHSTLLHLIQEFSRRDIEALRRVEEGLGESLSITRMMAESSESQSQEINPPSSPPERPRKRLRSTLTPTFAALSSPTSSHYSMDNYIPESPPLDLQISRGGLQADDSHSSHSQRSLDSAGTVERHLTAQASDEESPSPSSSRGASPLADHYDTGQLSWTSSGKCRVVQDDAPSPSPQYQSGRRNKKRKMSASPDYNLASMLPESQSSVPNSYPIMTQAPYQSQ